MNLKKEVFKFLEKNPKTSAKSLGKQFPGANQKSLWNYFSQWKKQIGEKATEETASIRQKVFNFFDKNPQASMKELKKAFPNANQVSISNYRYQWKKLKDNIIKKQSVKDQVFRILAKKPDLKLSELRSLLPDLKPTSVNAYHFQWKKKSEESNDQKTKKSVEKTAKKAAKKVEVAKSKDEDSDLLKALKTTIDAQKTTIEAMKRQNTLLKEKQSAVISELESLDDEQLSEIKKIISTYIKGMRKL